MRRNLGARQLRLSIPPRRAGLRAPGDVRHTAPCSPCPRSPHTLFLPPARHSLGTPQLPPSTALEAGLPLRPGAPRRRPGRAGPCPGGAGRAGREGPERRAPGGGVAAGQPRGAVTARGAGGTRPGQSGPLPAPSRTPPPRAPARAAAHHPGTPGR